MLSTTLQDGLSDYGIGEQDPGAAPEEEDGPGRARQAHRPVAGAALEDRARPAVSRRCRRCCASRWCSASASSSSSPARARSRSSRSCGRTSACSCPSGRARATWPTGSSRSTTRPPSAGSTATTPSSFRSRRTSFGRTSIRASSSSTRSQGTLSVHIGGDEHALEAGDSMYFDSTVPHAYRRSGGRPCSAVVVTSP